MTKYEVIAEALQEKVYNGELTLEDANIINDVAYDKYVTEGKFFDLFKKKKQKNASSKITYHEEQIGKFTMSIAEMDGKKVDKESIEACRDAIKNFNFSKFEKNLNKEVKKEYEYYISTVMDDEDEKLPLTEIINSRTRILFSWYSHDSKVSSPSKFDLWVSYNNWVDGKNSILCPEMECCVKDNDIKYNFHLG